MSAETLRRAASLMRERAEKATPGPWRVSGHDVVNDYEQVAETWLKVDAEHIAGMHRGVALAVADWLDREADGQDLIDSVERVSVEIDGEVEVAHSTYPEALAVARAFLGRDT